MFNNNNNIISYNGEFKYFKSAKTGSTRNIFYNCRNLKYATIEEGFTGSYDGLFQGCDSIMFIDIPSTATELGGYFWGGNWRTKKPNKKVICRATTPPKMTQGIGSAYSSAYPYRGLYVPDESVDLYKTTSAWSSYASYVRPLSEWDGTR